MSTFDTARPPAQSPLKTVAVVALVGALAAASVVLWLQNPDSEGAAIRQLPEQERRTLYERTLRTLQSSCDPKTRPSGLEAFCRQQAEFIVRFAECDAACASVAGPHRSVPSR